MYKNIKTWPFQEARSLLKMHGPFKEGDTVRLETGFGPSGLPHIGTFAEVARTTWVKNAFEKLTGIKAELIAFSDDMDGLRKVPLNLPNKEMLEQHLGKPLSSIPDPFGCCDSFSGHMNNKLKDFLDAFGFDYKFQSSSQAYKNGVFNEGLSIILKKHDEIKNVVAPTLREEKRADWSPIMPICPSCGKVYTTRVLETYPEKNTLKMVCDGEFGNVKGCGHEAEISVLNGNVKVGWKVDWALRWFTYGINYEMYGKDLIESAKLSSKICRILGKKPPAGLFYEMFLDEKGEKISKSVGKGLTVDSWMEYAPIESLLYYIFQNPKKAKRLYFEMIPKVVDDYLTDLKSYFVVKEEKRPQKTAWYIFNGNPPEFSSNITFSLVNNLVAAIGADNPDLIKEYLKRYDENSDSPIITNLVEKSMKYYRDFILPNKKYEKPSPEMMPLFKKLKEELEKTDENTDIKTLHSIPFNIAKEHEINPADFFTSFYKAVLGQERGPRFGSFCKLVGPIKLSEMISNSVK